MRKSPKPVTIAQQHQRIRAKYRTFESKIDRNSLTVKGQIKPTARSVFYSFVLSYSISKGPTVKIISPNLHKNEKGEDIPHMYRQKWLCLYRPKYREFRSSDYIAKKIIPWISLWLYYYEQWHITGKWLGGGEHPS